MLTNPALNIPASLTRIYERKLSSINDGNISVKLANKKYFHITPGGMKRKHDVKERDLVGINFNNGIYSITESNKTPSREIDLHALLQMNSDFDKDCCVVHCHPQNIIAYTGLTDHKELNTIKYFFPELPFKIGANVPYFPAGSYELATETYKNMNKNNSEIVMLENHGVIVKGTNLEYMIDVIEIIDYYCEIAIKDNVILLNNL